MSLPCLRSAFKIAASHTGVCAAIGAAFFWGAKVHPCIGPFEGKSVVAIPATVAASCGTRSKNGTRSLGQCSGRNVRRPDREQILYPRHPGDRRACARPIRDLPRGPAGDFRRPYSPGNLAAIKRFSRLPRRLAGGICISGLPAVCWCSKQPVPPGNGGHLRLWRSWMTGDQGFVSGVRARRRPLRPQTVQLRLR
jgi:hypothetical protein